MIALCDHCQLPLSKEDIYRVNWANAPYRHLKCPILTTTLYRPVGQKEFDLIQATNFTQFPPRLPEQPIFYPVCNEKYACEIAEKWNIHDQENGYIGYVLEFKIKKQYLDQFQVQIMGASHHQEYWIPAEELENFNQNIVDKIKVLYKISK